MWTRKRGQLHGRIKKRNELRNKTKARGEASRTGDRYPSEGSRVRVLPSDLSAGKALKRKPAVFTDLLITET